MSRGLPIINTCPHGVGDMKASQKISEEVMADLDEDILQTAYREHAKVNLGTTSSRSFFYQLVSKFPLQGPIFVVLP